jgi:hypothetical protein
MRDRQVAPWAVAAVVAMVVVIGGSIWNAMNTPHLPDMSKRETVRERLSRVQGIRPVLPVTLPAGYNFARDYDPYSVGPEPVVFDGTFERADYWEIFFFPEDGASKDGLPVIVFCVQNSNLEQSVCPEQRDRPQVDRQFGGSRVAIHRVSVGSRDMAAWKAVELTTDIAKVTWLR